MTSVASSRRCARPESPRGGGLLGEGLALGRALVVQAPGRCAGAALLLLAAAVTETFGLMMILPLLYVAGLAGASDEPGPVVEAVARSAQWLGIEVTLPAMLALFVGLAVVRSGVGWQRNVLLARLRLEFVDGFRVRLYTAVAEAKWEHLVAQRLSDVQHVLASDVGRAGRGASLLIQSAVTAVLAAAQLALAFVLAPLVSLAALLTAAVLLLFTRPLVRRSRDLGERLTGSGRELHASVTDFLGGVKLAKAHDAQDAHVHRFAEIVATARQRQLAFARLDSAAQAGLNVGAATALAGLAWLCLSATAVPLAELLVLVLVFARVTPAFFRLQRNAQQLAHVLPAFANAKALHRALRAAAEPRADEAPPAPDLRREIAVRSVSYVYPGAGARRALAGVDLTIPAHRMTAVTGRSGAGKTTFADILLGLIEPSEGELRIDGTPLAGTALRRWRRSVACVPQDPSLPHDSIRANLLWAQPEAKESEIWRALRLAAADEVVAALPHGLDTVTGDRGARLSGGERQRIALARALLRRPALLVLDEATGQLDSESEERILQALRGLRGRMTIVVVAHRAAVLRSADRIVVLDSGRVRAAGTRRETAPALAERGIDIADEGG